MAEDVKVVLFDWGNTLMQELPGAVGTMVDCPEVAAVPGALEALRELELGRRLVVATNAAESDPSQVRAALGRVGLDQYIYEVFRARELGAQKPGPAFFEKIVEAMGCTPAEMVMVGDSYEQDVLGAAAAGIRAVWYNPTGSASPFLPPVQAGEVLDMVLLPQVVKDLSLPGLGKCLGWLAEQGTPDTLLAHSRVVANMGYLLAVWLRQRGVTVDPLVTHRGGLLHDLGKLSSRKFNIEHGEYAARLLEDRQQPILAEIVRRHALDTLLDPLLAPRTWEEKLVYYADKLAEGSSIVTTDQRFHSLRQRYAFLDEKFDHFQAPLQALESEICVILDVSALELIDRLTKIIKIRVLSH